MTSRRYLGSWILIGGYCTAGAISSSHRIGANGPPPQNSRESTLRKEVSQLKRVLAEKTLELDFFKGALQKIEARRQQNDGSGAQASMTKSGK